MNQKYLSVYAIGAILFSTLIFSCNKEVGPKTDNQPPAETVAAIKQTANVYAALNNAFMALLGAAAPDGNTLVSGRKYGCANITATPGGLTEFPKDVVVDFGTEDCTLRGYTGKGIVRFTLDKWVYEPGASFEPELEDFYVNGYKFEGKYKITTVEVNKYKVEIIEGILTSPDNVVFNLKGEQYYTQIEGTDTQLVFGDDVFSITGTVGGTSSLELATKGDIKEPLIRRIDCDYISEGVMYLETGDISGDLDFGDGTCDDKGTLTMDFNGEQIQVPFDLPF